jgi:hypothetical protein
MSQAQSYADHYIPDVSRRKKLYEVLSDADLPAIADEMFEWEVKMVVPLELAPKEVSDIHERTSNPKLKRFVSAVRSFWN